MKSLPLTDLSACCAPLSARPMAGDQAVQLATVLKAVADPTRLRLLSLIASAEAGEVCVCDLTAPLGLTQPTVSHHLKVLLDVGLVEREKRGVWAYYSPVSGALDELAGLLVGRRSAGTIAPYPRAHPRKADR